MWKKLSVLVAITLCATTVMAQNTSGSIVGHVTDPTGAAVRAAKVTVTNEQTSEVRVVRTTGTGDYTAPLLNPGTYKVSIASTGFSTFTKSGIVLQVDQTVRANAVLQVGHGHLTVKVSAQALALDTDSPAIGSVIHQKQVADLPLNGRYFTDLILLLPGAVQSTGEQGLRIESGNAISVEGSRSSSNGYTLDGTSIMDYKFDTPAFNPSLDDIQEFKLLTDTYSAAYGYSVNQIVMSSKSGTNRIHGSLFEYLRNNSLDARNYFNRAPAPVAPLHQNQFGYSLGGPFIIPKLYNGRNKTFFFANYEGQRISTKNTIETNVPNADELQGKFPFPITNPATGTPFPSSGGITTIPGAQVSRLGKLIESKPAFFFPTPNSTGPFNYISALPEPTSLDQQNYRMDHTFSPSDMAFFRATISNLSQTAPNGPAAVSNAVTAQIARNYTLVYTHVFTPNLINQFRFGYLESLAETVPDPISTSDLSALNFKNIFLTPNNGYPNITFATYPGLPNDSVSYAGTGGAINTPSISNQPLYDLEDSVSWSHGKQNINFGFGMRWFQFDAKNDNNLTGSLAFNGQFSGNQIADLLLGDADSVGGAIPGPLSDIHTSDSVHIHLRDYAPYIQDNWQATSKLTFNLGLRYEFHATPFEGHNQFGWFDPNLTGGGLYVADPKVATDYGNGFYVNNGKRGDGPAPRAAFAPRFGFAYRLGGNNKTVVRGGYGLFYDTVGLTEFQGSTQFYPYSNSINITQASSPGPISTDNLFPATAFGPVMASTLQHSLYLFMPEKYKVPYIQDWSLNIQRLLSTRTRINIGYIGNKGTRLFQRIDVNQPTQCNVAHNCDPLTQTTATIQARRPYPNFGEILLEEFTGWSSYNALNVNLRHQSANLMLMAGYTWSKNMDDKSASAAVRGDIGGAFGVQNAHDVPADYARSDFDVGQRFSMSAVAALPFGRGQHFLGNVSRLTSALIGGWQLNAIYQLQKGLPFSIGAVDIGFVNEARGERANIIGNPYPSGFHKSIQKWFNTAAFANPAAGDFGNSGRNLLRGPKLDLLNLSVFKSFRPVKTLNVQTRLEAFNALNHAQFGNPGQYVGFSNFGIISSTSSANREVQLSLRLTF